MNETKHNQPPRRWQLALWVWLIFLMTLDLLMAVADLLQNAPRNPPYALQAIIGVVGATALLGLWLVIRWSCNLRNLGRLLVGVAIFATLVAIFYLEEDWRGKRAWEQCKAELEAKGALLDWNKFVPPSVPDDQNFYTVNTNFYLKFVRLQTEEQGNAARQLTWLNLMLSSSNTFPVFDTAKSKPPVVANLIISSRASVGTQHGTNAPVVKLGDSAAGEQVQAALRATLGRGITGAQGFKFSELQLSNLQPAQIFIQAESLPAVGDLQSLVPSDLATNLGRLRVVTTFDKMVFQVQLTDAKITSAAEYLQWSDQFVPAFDEIREALKRPYAIIPGDYSQPYLIPTPNFVLMRALAQTLAQRAQCDLLLGAPEKALPELTLMHDACRILQKPPVGQPETLVEAMINVAISGLYVSTVAEGFKSHAWREPQITALQSQLKSINLYTPAVNAFKMEQAATAHTLITLPASKIAEMFNLVGPPGKQEPPFWAKLKNPAIWFFWLIPRGWLYQNLVVAAQLSHHPLEAFDVADNRVQPRLFDRGVRETEKALRHRTLFNFWAAIAIPNFSKAVQVMSYNQTLINEAQVVCALERYQGVNHSYPDALDALVPQYLEAIPADLIGGEPLHYRRTDDGKFLLYSVGWNEADDGGRAVVTNNGQVDYTRGDWVWKN